MINSRDQGLLALSLLTPAGSAEANFFMVLFRSMTHVKIMRSVRYSALFGAALKQTPTVINRALAGINPATTDEVSPNKQGPGQAVYPRRHQMNSQPFS